MLPLPMDMELNIVAQNPESGAGSTFDFTERVSAVETSREHPVSVAGMVTARGYHVPMWTRCFLMESGNTVAAL